MEMSQLYDEDLLENAFLQQFCDMCPSLFDSVVENDWLICIPKVGTFEGHTLTELDCMSHVLISVDSLTYKTASDKHVNIKEKVITLGEGFDTTDKMQVLFSETFYTDRQRKYQVWCIDKPLSFPCTVPTSQPQVSGYRISNVDDAMELLFTGSNCPLKKNIDKMISTHKSVLRVGNSGLRDLIDMMHSLFTKCVQACHKDSQLKRRMALNKHICDNLHISVETYINHKLYADLFGYICTVEANKDAKLNKINRNLSQFHRTEFGMVPEFSSNLPRAKRELLTFASHSTPLAKMASIKRVILALMRNPKDSQELEPLTADDLIPMLVFLIVRSSIPTWRANFEYMTQFHFSKSSLNEYSFYMSTLEAAIFYIQSGELTKLLAADKASLGSSETGARNPELSPRIKMAVPPIDRLFESIRHSDLDSIKLFLEQGGVPRKETPTNSESLCHPLCSCDKCEQERDEEGTNPKSMVTVFSRDDKGYTAMHQAALYGHAAVIEYLTSHGSLLNATDYHSSTPLHIASQRGHQSAVMMLIDHGANVNSIDNNGNSPLHMATLNGHEDCVKALLYQTAFELIDVNVGNENGDTALHLAAKWSYESITRLLLEQGAWPEARNRRNATPMMLVSDGTIAQMLTNAIEKAQEEADDGFIDVIAPGSPATPACIASDIAPPDSFQTLPSTTPQVKVSSAVKKFLKCVIVGDINMAKHVMGWGEEFWSTDSSGEEEADNVLCHPLCQCKKCAPSQKSHSSLIDINAGDEQGRTALHIAAEHSHLDIVALLLEKRAEVNCKTNLVQFTPLHVACQQLTENKRLVTLLLENDAKVNCKDCNGRTPLHFSSLTGSLAISNILLEYNANVIATNVRGNTPLHEAAKVNNTDIVQLLLDHGCNPTIANKNGVTAMQITSDPKIIWLITEATNRWKEGQIAGVVPRKRSVCKTAVDRSRTQPEVSLRKNMFAALEEDDIQRLNQLTSSISTFNKKSLKRTVTRDRSAPLLDLSAIAAARQAVFGGSSMSPIADSEKGQPIKPAMTWPNTSKDEADLRGFTDTADPFHFEDDDDENDEQPECDLHLSKKTALSSFLDIPRFLEDSTCENSGTESAGEHES